MSSPVVFGVIPARGGSRGVLGKNLRTLHGKPLLNYIVESALNATKIDSVYVSTDSEAIAAQAKVIGAQAILHPSELSTDNEPTFGVIRNALSYFNQNDFFIDVVVTMCQVPTF